MSKKKSFFHANCKTMDMKDNPSQKNCQYQFGHPSFSNIEQECQESLIQGKIHFEQNCNKGFKYL